MVNRQLVRFLVDTGATGIVLTKIDADRVGIDVNPANYEVVGSGASGAVQGQFVDIDSLELDGKRADNIRGIVADGLEVSLLGQTFLTRYQVQMNGDEMVIR
jgi:aspartyl protease family protein